MFEYYGDIHVYCPGVGAYEPLGTLYTVDATEYVTAQIDATFHKGRGKWRVVS